MNKLASKSNLAIAASIIYFVFSPALAQLPRPIVRVVTGLSATNDGDATVDLGNGAWGLDSGIPGAPDNPIPVQEHDALSLLIGDRENPGIPPGDRDILSFGPRTTFPGGGASVICFGCNLPDPGIRVQAWSGWSIGSVRRVIADVALDTDSPDFDPDVDSVRIEVYFSRTAAETNAPPVANAGLDKSASFGGQVTLQGSASDADGDALTYSWLQLDSTTALVDLQGANTLTPSFTAPSQIATLEFKLTVSDGQETDSDNVKVFVTADGGGDPPPTGSSTISCPAEELADGNQPATGSVTQGTVTVEGSGVLLQVVGNDPDNSTGTLPIPGVSFIWEVVDGKGLLTTADLVTAKDGSNGSASFTAPQVGVDVTIEIAVKILDPRSCGTRITTFVKIQDVDGGGGPGNIAPTVQAGADRQVSKGENIMLPGSAQDPDGDVLTITWEQVAGPPVVLSSTTSATTTFTVPLETDTGAVIVLRLTASDNKGGETSDDISLEVLSNRAPRVAVAEDQLVSSSATALLKATGTDDDGDELSYVWTQIDGPAVSLDNSDTPEASFVAPDVTKEQGVISLFFEIAVSDGLTSAVATHRVDVKFLELNSLYFPSSVSAFHPFFQGTFVGVAVMNPNGNDNDVQWTALRGDGSNVEQGPDQALGAEGQKASLTNQVVTAEATTEARVLRARGTAGPIQGFFLIGKLDGTRLDGVGGSAEAKVVHMTIASHGTDRTTLYYIVNPSEESPVNVTVQLFDTVGSLVAEVANEIPAEGAAAGTLQQFFFPEDPDAEVVDGYVKVSAQEGPIRAFAVAATAKDYHSIGGQTPIQTRKLLVPHFFANGSDGDTMLRLLNTDTTATVAVKVHGFDDESNAVGEEGEFFILPRQIVEVSLKELLNLDTDALPPGQIVSGFARLELSASAVVFQKTPQVIGSLTFRGNGGQFRSTLPLVSEGRTETFFLHVAQSAAISFFTGVAIINPDESDPATVTVEMYDEDGFLVGDTTFEVPPGARVVDLLDGPQFFGLGFEQLSGHFRILSDSEVVPIALFGNFAGTVMSAIEGQAPIQ